ncbi:MAG: Spi family protease inhibitor, partial [Bacteroidota bacterium]|nr:Spi family protease inhibitor [Bacteroidota bacterium]
MKRSITFFCIFFLLSVISFGKPVDVTLARKVGIHFLSSFSNVPLFPRGADISLAYKEMSDQKSTLPSGESPAYYYIFNISGAGGFIIVAGDDIAQPILAYSGGKSFSPGKIPPHVEAWLEFYKQE